MKLFLSFWLLLAVSLLSSCKHDPEKPLPKQESAPSDLHYSPASFEMKTGTTVSSVKPSLKGRGPFRFAISTVPISQGAITISGEGVITAAPGLAVGIYHVSVSVSNDAGTSDFTNLFSITVTEQEVLPSGLTYSTDTLYTNEGEDVTTAPPMVKGTSPMRFSSAFVPEDNHLALLSQGEVKVSSGLSVGKYQVNITASNGAGSITFDKALVVVVRPVKPSGLSYTPDMLSLVAGNEGTSSLPAVKGTSPVSFALSVDPPSPGITIDQATGRIHAAAGLDIGNYAITVTATNAAGSTSFSNAYTITVTAAPVKPSDLVYTPGSITIEQGQSAISSTPVVRGTTPVTFSLKNVNPATEDITIHAQTGVISMTEGLAAGQYVADVEATNVAGNAVFIRACVITVNAAVAPSGLNYTPNILALTQGTAGTSPVPVISGSLPLTYSITVVPAASDITIGADGVISSGSGVAQGEYKVSVTATNAGGQATFTDIYTITVDAPPVTFINDIKPLMLSKCSGCHTTAGGSLTNYTVYLNSKSNVDQILTRVQLSPSANGYMPKGRSPLSTAEIDLIKAWKNQGLIE